MARDDERTPLASRVLARVLDHRKRIDYLWLILFAALPIGLAWGIGAHHGTGDGFVGYWERENWILLVGVLPAAAVLLRLIVLWFAPVSTPELPPSPPPLIELIDDAGKEQAYAALRKALLSPRVFLVAFVATFLFHVFDAGPIAGFYLSDASRLCKPEETGDSTGNECAKPVEREGKLTWLEVRLAGLDLNVEKDWSVAYLSADSKVAKWPNLALNLSAYAVQFALIFIGFLLITLFIRHNLFFLSRIYQRRRVPPGDEASYVHIDLDDEEKCFGFRPADRAFNVQVVALAIAAVAILVTRVPNVGPDLPLFSDFGQWAAVLCWLVALAVVSLPIMVKLLPRLPAPGAGRAPATLVGYLREFLSDENWAIDNDTPNEEVNAVAARFAENAFWPTGNNRAWQLYLLAFWGFFVALVPDPRAIVELPPWSKPLSWVLFFGLAWGATWALFRFLRAMLAYIDQRLVDPPAQPIGDGADKRRRKIPIGVFISYRRDDSAAYTGRLYDSLATRIDRDRLFMDIDKIPGGVVFAEHLKHAIGSARAMIAVIGPDWLTIAHGDGPPRIQDPNDYVHQEVATGLARGIRVFPVLVGGAAMPAKTDLPEGLRDLAGRNAVTISDSRWAHDVGLLIEDLEAVAREKHKAESQDDVHPGPSVK